MKNVQHIYADRAAPEKRYPSNRLPHIPFACNLSLEVIMKLIKNLGTFRNNTKSHSEKRGLFFCPGCGQLVKKRTDAKKH